MTIPAAVIMSVYSGDRLEWFEDCIASMKTESDQNLRIYLCKDGYLPTEIEMYIEDNRARFYKVLSNRENLGLSRSLNRLIDSLDDEQYVFRMDADDICISDRFVKQIAFMESHPEVMMCGGSMLEFKGTTDNVLMKRTYPCSNCDIRNYIAKTSPFGHPTVCFRRKFFDQVGRYPTVPYSQDVALWFDALKKNVPVANLPDPLVYFRVTELTGKRRGRSRAWGEFIIFFKGTLSLHGCSALLLWPFVRFAVSLFPSGIIQKIYNRGWRKGLNQ